MGIDPRNPDAAVERREWSASRSGYQGPDPPGCESEWAHTLNENYASIARSRTPMDQPTAHSFID